MAGQRLEAAVAQGPVSELSGGVLPTALNLWLWQVATEAGTTSTEKHPSQQMGGPRGQVSKPDFKGNQQIWGTERDSSLAVSKS